MVQNTKANGKTVNQVEKGNSSTQTEIFLRVIGRMIKHVATEY